MTVTELIKALEAEVMNPDTSTVWVDGYLDNEGPVMKKADGIYIDFDGDVLIEFGG